MGADDKPTTDTNKRQPIYIQDFVDVHCSYDSLRLRFSGDTAWLSPLASAATIDGETMRLRVGPSWSAGVVSREVQITLGPAREGLDTILRSLAWEASDLPSLFPLVEGDIELAPIDQDVCRVSLAVIYTPPLGEFGARVDRAIMHRIAQSTVRSFISRIATNLQSDARPST
jgi:hypothetical protein